MLRRIQAAGVLLSVLLTGMVLANEPEPLTEEQMALNVESFDVVWQTIHDKHFDTSFGGVDWNAAREELQPKMDSATTMRQARRILNDLINRLGLSHFAIIPQEVYRNIDKPKEKGDYGGRSGIWPRVLANHAVVVEVVPGTPGAEAGVEPGWEILEVNGEDIPALFPSIYENFAGKLRQPLYLAQAVLSRINGKVGDTVRVLFLDGDNNRVEKTLVLTEAAGKKTVFGNLLPFYLRTKTDTLDQGVGYFALNCFFDPPTLVPAYSAAVKGLGDAPGFIIDVRGNPGGIGALASNMIGWLVDEKGLYFGTLSTRDTELKMIVNPRPRPFKGKVAVLVDGLSGSTSEFLAGGLKDIGRARVFGTNSVGAALPSTFEILPNGDRFQYVMANFVLGSGALLEGAGVAPDEEVRLNRKALLEGRDPVIEAAVAWILTDDQIEEHNEDEE